MLRKSRGSGGGRKRPVPQDEPTEVQVPRPTDFLGGRFRIVKALGDGGFGSVHQAYDTKFERMVALKFLHHTLLFSAAATRRFEQEATITAGISHPNVVTLFESGMSSHGTFLVLEYVDGESLYKMLMRTDISMERALHFARQIALALDAAHSKDVFHRDIKPENILITPSGDVKVTDFGIAVVRNQVTRITETGSVVGTRMYMAPEYLMQGHFDARSDLFSFGCVFFQMLAGQHPFYAPTNDGIAARIRAGDHDSLPAPMGSLVPLLDSMLALDPDKRPATARVVLDRINAYIAGGTPTIAMTSLPIASSVPSTLPASSIAPEQVGIRAIYATRRDFNSHYSIADILETVPDARIKVIGKSLLTLLQYDGAICTALSKGTNLELAIVDPSGGRELFPSTRDITQYDVAGALRQFQAIIDFIKKETPRGTIELRFHRHPTIDTYLEVIGGEHRFSSWDLSFGRTERDKTIMVFDPDVALGKKLAKRYETIWSEAKTAYHWDGARELNRTNSAYKMIKLVADTPRKPTRTKGTVARRFRVQSAPAQPGEIKWIYELERRHFGRDAVPEPILRQWYNANPQGFVILRAPGDVKIGYLGFLPVQNGRSFREFTRGKIREREIRASEIFRADERKDVRDVYIECFIIDPPPALHDLQPLIRKNVFRDIHAIFNRICIPEHVRRVWTLAVSDEGEALIKHLGFKLQPGAKKRLDKHNLYMTTPMNIFVNIRRLT